MALKPAKRICSLLPSATEIVGRLGLVDRLVCVTHECDVLDTSNESKAVLDGLVESGIVARVTSSAINPEVYTQAKIDQLVSSSLSTGSGLYGVDNAAMAQQNPDLIITQELCAVCAPSTQHVASALEVVAQERQARSAAIPSGSSVHEDEQNLSSPPLPDADVPRVLSLEPQSLLDVCDSFLAVANACGEQDRGRSLHTEFLNDLNAISNAISQPAPGISSSKSELPKVFILEWLDPPFDAGHWVPEVLSIALGNISETSCASGLARSASLNDSGSVPQDVAAATKTTKPAPEAESCAWDSKKSRRITWDDVAAADPDVLVVACCGFDFPRNCGDGQAALSTHPKARGLRAVRSGRVFAVDGNRYLARPGPSLVQGAAAVAACIWSDDAERMSALEATGVLPERDLMWGRIPLQLHASPTTWQVPIGLPSGAGLPTGLPNGVRGALGVHAGKSVGAPRSHTSAAALADIESAADACMGAMHGAHAHASWSATHSAAVARGDNFYEDPETKLMVMTELVHRSRGSCCGKACRHCPFMHERVVLRSRPNEISRPAWLVPPPSPNTPLTSQRPRSTPSALGGAQPNQHTGVDTAVTNIAREGTTKSSATPSAPSSASTTSSDSHSNLAPGAAATGCEAAPVAAAAVLDSAVSSVPKTGENATQITVLLSGCSDEDLEIAAARQKQGELVVLVAPLAAESRKLDGTNMHAKQAYQRATDAGVPLVGLPVHASGPSHSELLRDALQVATSAAAMQGAKCIAEVQESLGEAAEQWRIALDSLQFV